jgi:hypothetical protein
MGVEDILEAVITRIPAPKGDRDAPLKALIIDSWFDNYVGVVMLVRVVDGSLKPKDKIMFMSTGVQQLCEQVGVFTPKSQQRDTLSAGQVGFIIAGIKELKSAKVGDTITLANRKAERAAGWLQGNQAPGVSRACTRWSPTSTTSCANPSKSCASMMRPCSSSPKCPRPWVSASAAASWGCFTWRSSRSAWSVNLT